MKSITLLAASLLALATAASANVDLGTASSRTPYDSYMQPVKAVLGQLEKKDASLDQVRSLMREAFGFRYSFTTPYVAATPAETSATRKGDCKAKALWLVDRMGDSNVRFVVGKSRRSAKLSHAWVLWENNGRWWILDPTNTSQPIPADRVSSNEYIPLYSWAKGRTFQHSETGSYMAAVARKNSKRTPVADPSVAMTTPSAFFHR
jgi:hypothetical protein